MQRLVGVILLLAAAQVCCAQSFTVFNYSVPEGLPSSEVYQVFEDKKGFLWFATDNGVVKFDGKEMELFHMKDGMTDPVVFTFFEDGKGRIWFRSYSGKLCYYENGKIKKYIYNDLLAKQTVHGIINFVYLSDKEELHYAVRNNVGKIDRHGNITKEILEKQGLFYWSKDGHDLLTSTNRYATIKKIFVGDYEYPIVCSDTVTFQNGVHRAVRWRNKLYLTIYNDIFEFDGTVMKSVHQARNPIISATLDGDDNLWIGYMNGGAERFEDPSFKNSWKPEFVRNKSVTSVYQSKQEGIWFSTLESGVFYVPNISINNFSFSTLQRTRAVVKFGSNILLADQSGNIRAFDMKSGNQLWSKSFGYVLQSMFADRQGRLWVSNNQSISIYDRSFNLKKSFPGLIAVDFSEETDSTVWTIGGFRVSKFSAGGNFEMNNNRFLDIYRTLLVDDSLLYLSLRMGMDIRNKNYELVKSLKQFSGFKITDMARLNDSTLLMSTMGTGFLLFNTRTQKSVQYSTDHDFIANNVYSNLVQDSLLWIGTENGLAVTSLPSLLRGKPVFNYLGKMSGLISNNISYLVPGDKAVWAFSDVGFSIIPNSIRQFANKNPVFFIKEVLVNDEAIEQRDHLDLEHAENNIKINFGFISFNNPNIFLRHKIRSNNPWIKTTERSLLFSSLAPGEYTFQLEYSADNIHWQQAIVPFTFTIGSPWWNKWYFQIGAFIILVVLGYLYFRYQQSIYRQKHHYLKIINEHQQKLIQSEIVTLERERNRIAKELHDGVGTNLTAIKLMVNQLLKNYKEPLAHDVEEQFQIAIREIKEIIYGLTPPSLERYGLFTGLKNYVTKLNKSIPINISLKTFGNDSTKYELNIMVFRVLQELLSNSIKHSYARNITIHISSFDDLLNIVYEDDGIGFSYKPEQNGLGLDSIESRLQSINGTLKFESGKFGISYTIDIPLTLKQEAT